jgi:polyisoprenyl-phosphate glycosyltransferase
MKSSNMENIAENITFSIIVPVYNSEKSLKILYTRLCDVMEMQKSTFEIIFVDDCSRDNAWEVLSELAQKDERVIALQLMRNYGQSAATMCGLRHAKGRFMITIDDDLQNPPEEIPVLINALSSQPHFDVVIGVPQKKKHALWRRLGSNVLNKISSSLIFRQMPPLTLTSFRIMRRSVTDYLLSVDIPRPAPGAILCTITPRITNVQVRHEPRTLGKGGYRFTKILGLTLDKTLNFSTYPLRMLAILGIVGIVCSFSVGSFFFIRYLFGGIKVAGWMTLVILLAIISGFNFFAFGIIGEYLLRILHGVHKMPQYLIRETLNTRDQLPPDEQ